MKKCNNTLDSFACKNEKLLKEWDYDKNTVSPFEIYPNSRTKIFWKCEKGHSWHARLDSRNNSRGKGTGCPYCKSRKTNKSNSFGQLRKDLLKDWDWDKNDIGPFEFSIGSSKKAWWTCSKKHSWRTKINDRVNGTKCPYCQGTKINDDNCLANSNKNLMLEWDWDKNKINPYSISPFSHKKVWWLCNNKHSWTAEVNQRQSLKTSCPFCIKSIKFSSGLHFDSLAEAYFYLKNLKERRDVEINGNYANGDKRIGNCRFDFYCKSDNLYIEVTSYNKKWKKWFSYLRNIARKKKYVTEILNGNFSFCQIDVGAPEKSYVNRFIKGEKV